MQTLILTTNISQPSWAKISSSRRLRYHQMQHKELVSRLKLDNSAVYLHLLNCRSFHYNRFSPPLKITILIRKEIIILKK